MGLMLRDYLFYNVSASDVCGALKEWYAAHGIPLDVAGPVHESIDVHEPDNNWVVAELSTPGWYWKERRKVGAFMSKRLWCPGFLVFVYDGEYWGYEFYDRGEALDRFAQDEEEAPNWFPSENRSGNAQILAEHLPFLDIHAIQPYIIQSLDWRSHRELRGKVRPGDEFDRFDQCAIIDFLRALGISSVGLREGYVTFDSPVHCSLWRREDWAAMMAR